MNATDQPDLPLRGLTVVSLEQAVAAPYCTCRLADAGARVIKIEREEGDFARHYDHVVKQLSTYFVWTNRGKESLVLDIKKSTDQALLHRIIASSDVFIQNLAPGATARLGFAAEQLRADHPELITVDISGYGETGPFADMKAYDLLVQGESGLASITGSPQSPGRVGVSICDISCGMYAYSAILEALISRSASGQGQSIKLSLFDSVADWMTVPLLHHEYGGRAPQRVGLNHPNIAPYGAYTCLGSEQVILSIQNDREWCSFCEKVLGQASVATDPKFSGNVERCEHRAELDRVINEVFSVRPRTEVIERLKAAQIAFGALNSVADLAAHPQLRRMQVMSENGLVDLVAPPAISSLGERRIGEIPRLGAHTDALRREFSDEVAP